MNERIQELAEQVKKWISTSNFEGMPEDEMTYEEIFNKKFAELVIEETHYVTVVRGVDDLDDVMKHFGVEE